MKSILFASTALVAFAGAAAAQGVTLTGTADMGINNRDTLSAPAGVLVITNGETTFHTDIDVTFTMAGETDNGLTFGASIDLDESGNGQPFEAAGTQGGETIFLSGAFGTITMGDTDGALDWALTEVAFNSGSLNDDETAHAGFNANSGLDGLFDGQILRYDYSVGGFGVALSAELAEGRNADDVFGLGLKYGLDLGGSTVNFGLGYQMAQIGTTDVDALGVSVGGSFGGGFTAGLSYVSYQNHVTNAIADGAFTGALAGGRILTPGFDSDHIGVGVGYTTGAISASLNYGQYSIDAPGFDDIDGLGLTVGYDLGGGAAVQFGYGRSNYGNNVAAGADDTVDSVSFGVRMNF